MNLTIANSSIAIRRRMKAQHFALAAACALAVSAAVALTPWQGEPTSAPVAPARRGPAVSISQLPEAMQVYYLVESEAGAETLRSVLRLANQERMALGVPEPNEDVSILVAGSPEEEREALRRINIAVGEQTAAGIPVKFVEAR